MADPGNGGQWEWRTRTVKETSWTNLSHGCFPLSPAPFLMQFI